MSSSNVTTPLAPEIRTLLGGLRWRIRAYVWAEGLATAVLWLAVTYWAILALDYLPVVVWASELPRGLRMGGLIVIAAVLAWILFRYILARTFVRLRDRSMAILLERRFPEFRDSLVTAVELANDGSDDFSREMLETTRQQALARLPQVRLGDIFRRTPLLACGLGSVLLVIPIVIFATAQQDMFQLSLRRLYLLTDDPWPRSAEIEIVGIEVERISPRTGELIYSENLPFVDREVKVARGATFSLQVRANARRQTVPEVCRIYYRLADGARGQVAMRRDGAPRDDFQYFSFTGKPFQGILDDVRFDVVGSDHRVRNHAIRVVETPAVVETILDCQFPEYLIDRSAGLWLPREVEYRSSGTQLPAGTKVTIRCRTNKPLARIEFSEPGSGKTTTREHSGTVDSTSFEYTIDDLRGGFVLDIALRDTDNVLSEAPHRIFLSAVNDTAPQVDVVMRGIGSAVTPDVLIPAAGTIRDDHSLAAAWFEFQINGQQELKQDLQLPRDGTLTTQLDFRDLRLTRPEAQIKAGDRLLVAIRAKDRYDLDSGPNVGSSERLELEVVTPDELLIRLDRRELAERRRFEHVLDELTQMRDSLIRVQNEIDGITPLLDPTERIEADSPADPAAQPESRIDLRGLRAQQALRQSQKSAAEVLGVAAAFYSIREELINNRVDSEDRQSRIKEQVADPLQKIGEQMFPELDRRLAELEKAVALNQNEAAAVEQSITYTNELLVQLTTVLEAMLDIESYNELIEIVRSLIDDQQRLIDETKKARKRDALDLLK